MGSFFTNIQLHVNSSAATELRERLVAALRSNMALQDYVAATPDELYDRTILVGPLTSHPWIAVYDQNSEGQDEKQLDILAAYLSKITHDKAVSILVHDGDLLTLSSFQDGSKAGEITNWPGYFTGESKPLAPLSENDDRLTFWHDLLIEGATERDLRNAWMTQTDFEAGSSILAQMAPLVDWHPELCRLGYDTIPESVLSHCTALHFRREDTQRTQEDEAVLPVLSHEGGDGPTVTARVGDAVALLGISHNTGGASQGVTIVVWGAAVDTGLVNVTLVNLLSGSEANGQLVEARFVETPSDTGRIYEANIPAIEISSGFRDAAAAFAAAGGQYAQGLELWLAARLQARVACTALQPGVADIHIGFVPMANPTEGQTSWTIEIKIIP